MDGYRWKTILFEWIKSTELVDVLGSLENLDLPKFYEKFRNHVSNDFQLAVKIDDFIKDQLPDFEILYDDTGRISPLDFMYIISFLLYYSCVRQAHPYSQKCCSKLDQKHQLAIAKFFGLLKTHFDNKDKINKTLIRQAIHQSAPLSPGVVPFLQIGSPIRTPKANKSPPTPTRQLFMEKTRELKTIKAQLDTERYERGCLEVQVKLNEEKILNMTQDRKKLNREIQELRSEHLSKDTENSSPNKLVRDEQLKYRLGKEISERDEKILDLKCEVERLQELIQLSTNRMTFTEKEMLVLKERIKDLDASVDDLREQLEAKDEKIIYLQESNAELQTYINETRTSISRELNSSCEGLDFSNTIGFNSTSSGENLGKCIIDLQLKEREVEIQNLKEVMDKITTEKNELEAAKIQLDEEMKSLQTTIEHHTVTNENSSKDIKALALLLETTKVENKTYHAGLVHAKEQIDIFQKDLSNIQTTLEQSKEQAAILVEEKSVISKELEDTKTVFKKKEQIFENVVAQIKSNIDTLRQELKLKDDELEKTHNEKETIEKEHELELEKLHEKRNNDIKNMMHSKDQQIEKVELKFRSELKECQITKKSLDESSKVKITQLQHQIEEHQIEMKNFDSKIDSLETLVEKIEKEKSNLMKNLNDKNKEMESIIKENEEQCNEMKDKIKKLQQELEVTSTKTQEVLKEFTEKNEAIESIKEVVKENDEARKVQLQDIEILSSKNIALDAEVASKVEELKKVTEELEKFTVNSMEVQKSFEEYQITSEQKMSLLEVNLEETENILKSKRLLVEDNEVTINELQVKISTAEEVIANLNEELQNQTSEVSVLQKEVFKKGEIENVVETLKKLLSDREIETEELKMRITSNDSSLSQFETQFKMLQSFLTKVEKEKQESIQGKLMLQQEFEVMLEDVENLKTSLSQNENELKTVKKVLDEKDSVIEELQKKVVSEETLLDTLKTKRDATVKENVDLGSKLSEVSIKLDNLIVEKIEAEKKMKEREEETKVMQKALDELNKTRVELENKKLSSETSVVKLKETLVEFTKELEMKDEDLEAIKKDAERNQIVSQEQEASIEDLKEQISKLMDIKTELLSKQTQSDTEVSELNVELSQRLEYITKMEEENVKAVSTITQSLAEAVAKHLVTEQKQSNAEKTIVELQQTLAKVTEEQQVKEVEVSQMIATIDEYVVASKQQIETIDNLQQQIESLKESQELVLSTKSTSDAQVCEMQVLLKEREQSLVKIQEEKVNIVLGLEQSLAQEVAKYQVAEQKQSSAQTTIVELQQTLAKVTEEQQAKKIEVSQMIATIDEYVVASKQQIETIDNLQQQIELLKESQELVLSTKSTSDAQVCEMQVLLKEREKALVDIQEEKMKIVHDLEETSAQQVQEITKITELLQEKDESLMVKSEQVNTLENELKSIKESQEKLSEDLTSCNSEITDLKTRLEVKESLVVKMEEEKVNHEQIITKLQQSSLELELKNVQDTTEKQSELLELQNRISNKEQLIENLSMEKNVLLEEKEQIVRKKAIIESELTEVKDLLTARDAEVMKSQKVIEEKTNQLNENEKEVIVLEAELKELNARMSEEREAYSVDVKEFNKKLSDNDEMKSGVYLNIDELKDQKTKLREECEKIKNENKKEVKKNVELNEKLTSLKQDLVNKDVAIGDLEMKNASLKDNLQRHIEMKVSSELLETQYNVLKERADDVECSLKMMMQENGDLKEEVEIKSRKIENLKENGDEKHLKVLEKMDVLEKEVSLKTKHIEDSEKKIQALVEEKHSLDITVVELTTSNKKMQEKVLELEQKHATIVDEMKDSRVEISSKIIEKDNTILEMLQQIDELKVVYREQINGLEIQLASTKRCSNDESSRINDLLEKLKIQETLSAKFKELELAHEKEKQFNDNLNESQKILHAKLLLERQKTEEAVKQLDVGKKRMETTIIEERRVSEERLKESRLEMEGKLEKMKDKMKSLYNDEVAKKNIKHEEKMQEMRAEIAKSIRKHEQYDQHIEKLTKQTFQMNEIKLKYNESMRENEFIRSKLRFMEKSGGMLTSGGSSIGLNRNQGTTLQNSCSNMRMEDEEGEMFNNTYLADIKMGGSALSLEEQKVDAYSASELQKRNSMCLPHMRSSYTIVHNTDKHFGEDEIRDGQVNLDDSEASLLQTGHRKKQSTSYKKPGPPTPSKNAGRLSIGGSNDVHYNHILKESNNNDNLKKGTPSRLKMLFSNSSKAKETNEVSFKPFW
ncbi:unnamed protein product [Diamesa serratosioi]